MAAGSSCRTPQRIRPATVSWSPTHNGENSSGLQRCGERALGQRSGPSLAPEIAPVNQRNTETTTFSPLRASHRRCEDQVGEYPTCPRPVPEGTAQSSDTVTAPPPLGTVPRGMGMRHSKSASGLYSPRVVAPEVTRTIGASSKYFRGDSPRRTSVVPAPATTKRSDRSLDHRHRRPVAGSYSSSNQPRPNASIEPDSRWASNWRIASSPAAPPAAFRAVSRTRGVGTLPRRDAAGQPGHVEKAGAGRPVVVRPGIGLRTVQLERKVEAVAPGSPR